MLKLERHREDEWMDAPNADPVALEKSLRFIRQINTLLRYSRATLGHLHQMVRKVPAGRTITILDVATGSADIPQAILHWADRTGIAVRIVGIDLHEATLLTAAKRVTSDRLGFVRADATRLPHANGAFDFVITGMFLHHLDEPIAIEVLNEMNRVAARGVIVADLLRSRRALLWIRLFTMLANPMVKHDARVSVTGAFSEAELLALRDRAGMRYLQPHRHFGHRLVLAGMKASAGDLDGYRETSG